MKSTTVLSPPSAALAAGNASAALSPTAANINEAHRLARSSAETAVAQAIECGRLLAAKKSELSHGEFMPWVEKHCDFAYSTAARYMKASQSSTAVEISSLSRLFPSGQPGAKPKTESKEKGGQAKVDAPKPSPTAEPAAVHGGSAGPSVAPDEFELPADDEDAADLERAEREYQDRMAKVIESDDRLATANDEIRKLSGLYAAVARERDRAQNEQGRLTRLLKAAERKIDRLEAQLRGKTAA